MIIAAAFSARIITGAQVFPLGTVGITGVHASPSKTGNNTEPITPTTTCCSGLTANINGPGSVCAGQNVTLTATGGSTYLWSTGVDHRGANRQHDVFGHSDRVGRLRDEYQ